MKKHVYIFDLDDTLYKEIDFLKSAYKEIAEMIGHPEAFDFMLDSYLYGENAFNSVIEKYHLLFSVDQLLEIYRKHKPDISLDKDTIATLDALKARGVILCLLTDGRSVTQRNKIEALGLYRWIAKENILISEEFSHGKPSIECYQYFLDRYPNAEFTAVGDNPAKDFLTPNQLGWATICILDDGRNIHKQDFEEEIPIIPAQIIKEFKDILDSYLFMHQ